MSEQSHRHRPGLARGLRAGEPAACHASLPGGYQTIRSFRQIGEKRKYTLAFPNYEVTDSFLSGLALIHAGIGPTEATSYQFAAQEALAQIDERNYADKYDFAGKTVRKLGISFSSEKRTIVDVKVG